MTTTITVPNDKAEALRLLALLNAEALKLLANKLKGANDARIKDIEAKIKNFHPLI